MRVADGALGTAVHTELEFCERSHKIAFCLLVVTIRLTTRERVQEILHVSRIDGTRWHSRPSGGVVSLHHEPFPEARVCGWISLRKLSREVHPPSSALNQSRNGRAQHDQVLGDLARPRFRATAFIAPVVEGGLREPSINSLRTVALLRSRLREPKSRVTRASLNTS